MQTAHVRIVTPAITRDFRKPGDFDFLETPTLKVSHRSITTGPASIESAFESSLSEPGTLARIVEAEREGVDAVVLDCMGDPALWPAREAVTIPVLGPSQTSMHVAAMLGHRFSVVTVAPRLRVQFENLAAVYGLSVKLASVRSIDIPVLELEKDIVTTQARLVDAAESAIVADGAHAIVFGCTGLLGCASAVGDGLRARGYDIPVIDPIPTTVRIAGALVLGAVRHSKLTSPFPPEKAIVGYPDIRIDLRQAAE